MTTATATTESIEKRLSELHALKDRMLGELGKVVVGQREVLEELLVTIFAGYWHPSFRTRAWVRAFFLLVRLQRYVPIAPPVVSNPDRVLARKAVA